MFPVALRIDDIGASTKRYEVYSEKVWRWRRFRVSGNWLFLKYLPGLRGWGVYREMRPDEWQGVFRLLEAYQAKLTVAITAAWAKSEHELIPFPQKFPGEAAALKEGLSAGLLEIANHGLTHCVLENDVFKPKWFESNRRYHREFWDWIPLAVHDDHLRRAQDILQGYFDCEVITFVPPGNVYTEDTLMAACKYGLRVVSCSTPPRQAGAMTVVGNENVLPFHDRELVLQGIGWLENVLRQNRDKQFCFVKDLA